MKALLVIDMLNDFCCEEGALYFPEGKKIILKVQEIIRKFIRTEESGLIIFLNDSHGHNDKEFKRFPKHAIVGTWGAEIVQELKYYFCRAESHIINKKRYSGFYNTKLESCFKKNKIDEVWVVGVCTDICVMFTVEELCNRDIKTKVFKKAVASFNNKRHKFALDIMENVLGAEIF